MSGSEGDWLSGGLYLGVTYSATLGMVRVVASCRLEDWENDRLQLPAQTAADGGQAWVSSKQDVRMITMVLYPRQSCSSTHPLQEIVELARVPMKLSGYHHLLPS